MAVRRSVLAALVVAVGIFASVGTASAAPSPPPTVYYVALGGLLSGIPKQAGIFDVVAKGSSRVGSATDSQVITIS